MNADHILGALVVREDFPAGSGLSPEDYERFLSSKLTRETCERLALAATLLWDRGLFFGAEQLFALARLGLTQTQLEETVARAGEHRVPATPAAQSKAALTSSVPKPKSFGIRPKR